MVRSVRKQTQPAVPRKRRPEQVRRIRYVRPGCTVPAPRRRLPWPGYRLGCPGSWAPVIWSTGRTVQDALSPGVTVHRPLSAAGRATALPCYGSLCWIRRSAYAQTSTDFGVMSSRSS